MTPPPPTPPASSTPPTPAASTTEELRPIRRVLICIGLTPESIGGLHMGRLMAEKHGAEVHALHVVEPFSKTHRDALPELAARHMDIAKEELSTFLGSHGYGEAAASVKQHVREGTAEEEILRCAAEIDADLLVFGRYGRGGLKRDRLGSIASRLVRQSPVSVLLAQPLYRDTQAVGRVGVACEFETDPDPAVERAGDLCRRLGVGGLTLVHAYDLPVGYHTIMTEEQVVSAINKVAEERTQVIADRFAAQGGPRVALHTEMGSVGEQVPRMAEMEKLDMLVFSSHHRTRPAMFLMPRTTEKILSGLGCSAWIERTAALHENAMDAIREIVTGS